MPEITLEKTHALLERLAEYVMTELPAIKQDVALLKQDVAGLKQDVASLKQDVASLKQDVAGLKQDVAGLKQDVALLKQDVAGLKQDVALLKQDVAGLKQDVALLKQDVAGLKQDVASLRTELAKKADKEDVMFVYSHLSKALAEKADRKDVEQLKDQFDVLLEGMDRLAKELDIHRTERAAISRTLDVYNDRLGALEEHNFGTRVRDVKGMNDEPGLAE